LIVYRLHNIGCTTCGAYFIDEGNLINLSDLLRVHIHSIKGIQEVVDGGEDLRADPESHSELLWHVNKVWGTLDRKSLVFTSRELKVVEGLAAVSLTRSIVLRSFLS
jgi:hypothetical protein